MLLDATAADQNDTNSVLKQEHHGEARHTNSRWSDERTIESFVLVSQCSGIKLYASCHNAPTGFLGEGIAFKSAGAVTATKASMRPVLTQKSIPMSVLLGFVECHVSSKLVAGSRGQIGRVEVVHKEGREGSFARFQQ